MEVKEVSRMRKNLKGPDCCHASKRKARNITSRGIDECDLLTDELTPETQRDRLFLSYFQSMYFANDMSCCNSGDRHIVRYR